MGWPKEGKLYGQGVPVVVAVVTHCRGRVNHSTGQRGTDRQVIKYKARKMRKTTELLSIVRRDYHSKSSRKSVGEPRDIERVI